MCGEFQNPQCFEHDGCKCTYKIIINFRTVSQTKNVMSNEHSHKKGLRPLVTYLQAAVTGQVAVDHGKSRDGSLHMVQHHGRWQVIM